MEITIRVSKKRNVPTTLEVDGVKGSACLLKTANLRKKLAASGDGLTRKPDFKDVVTCLNVSQ